MSDEWAKKIYERLWWICIWLAIIAMNTCPPVHVRSNGPNNNFVQPDGK